MESPADYFSRTKDSQRQALKMLGHPVPSPKDPLVEHFRENVEEHRKP